MSWLNKNAKQRSYGLISGPLTRILPVPAVPPLFFTDRILFFLTLSPCSVAWYLQRQPRILQTIFFKYMSSYNWNSTSWKDDGEKVRIAQLAEISQIAGFMGIDLSVKVEEGSNGGSGYGNCKDFFSLQGGNGGLSFKLLTSDNDDDNGFQDDETKQLVTADLNGVAVEKNGSEKNDISTGLQLMTALPNCASDRSTVEDCVSPVNSPQTSDPDDSDPDPRTKVDMLQRELTRINEENKKLNLGLNHIANNCPSLKMDLTSLMEQPRHSHDKVPEKITSSRSDGTMRNNGRSSTRKVEEAAGGGDLTSVATMTRAREERGLL